MACRRLFVGILWQVVTLGRLACFDYRHAIFNVLIVVSRFLVVGQVILRQQLKVLRMRIY